MSDSKDNPSLYEELDWSFTVDTVDGHRLLSLAIPLDTPTYRRDVEKTLLSLLDFVEKDGHFADPFSHH